MVEGLRTLEALGATAAADLVRGRLRRRGVTRLPRRPLARIRANPAGLTDRQLEVLALLADGLTNAEIADRLVVSVRTVDHHVAAILAKLGGECPTHAPAQPVRRCRACPRRPPVRAPRRPHRPARRLREYAAVLPPAVFGPYLADILDLEARDRGGRLLVAEHDRRVVGTVTFYEDAAAEGLGWPPGWAGLRALGVDPAARGLGAGRALVDACLDGPRPPGRRCCACTRPPS